MLDTSVLQTAVVGNCEELSLRHLQLPMQTRVSPDLNAPAVHSPCYQGKCRKLVTDGFVPRRIFHFRQLNVTFVPSHGRWQRSNALRPLRCAVLLVQYRVQSAGSWSADSTAELRSCLPPAAFSAVNKR